MDEYLDEFMFDAKPLVGVPDEMIYNNSTDNDHTTDHQPLITSNTDSCSTAAQEPLIITATYNPSSSASALPLLPGNSGHHLASSYDHEVYNPNFDSASTSASSSKLISFESMRSLLPGHHLASSYDHEVYNPIFDSASAPASSSKSISFESMRSLLPGNSGHHLASSYDHEVYNPNFDSTILNFEPSRLKDSNQCEDHQVAYDQKNVKGQLVRGTTGVQDNLMAERKRLEKLTQLFIGLSKVLPGIKKLDKASILEDAIEHLKSLQERISVLEKEQAKYDTKISPNAPKDIYKSSSSNSKRTSQSPSAEAASAAIKVRISNRSVLINICCKKHKGFMSRIHSAMEKLNLCEIDVRAMSFGDDKLDITILAQMQSEFCSSGKDIIDHLEMAFLNALDTQN